MTESYFNRFLEEIYSNFGRQRPAFGTPMYKNLQRRLEDLPDEAAQEIAYAFSEYDSLPMNLGKAIRAEYTRWRIAHPEKVARRFMCPDCDPRAGAGYVYVHDADGRNYLARCTCNDDMDSNMAMATSDRLQAQGLLRGYVINPADPDGTKARHEFLSPETRAKLATSMGLGARHRVRAEHMQAREAAGAEAYDAF